MRIRLYRITHYYYILYILYARCSTSRERKHRVEKDYTLYTHHYIILYIGGKQTTAGKYTSAANADYF